MFSFPHLNSVEIILSCLRMFCRVLKIVFQISDGQISPISVEPSVRLAEYKIDFDAHKKKITHVWHKLDGAVSSYVFVVS